MTKMWAVRKWNRAAEEQEVLEGENKKSLSNLILAQLKQQLKPVLMWVQLTQGLIKRLNKKPQMLPKPPHFHSESLFLFVKTGITIEKDSKWSDIHIIGVSWCNWWDPWMDIASALILKNNLTRKSSTPLLITGGRNDRKEKKRKETQTTIKFITYTLLADDTCSRCTIKPTTLYYYGNNYCECFFHVDQLAFEGCFFDCFKLA